MNASVINGLRAAATLLLVCAGATAVAQQPATTRYVVQVTQLKPDRVDEWRALQQNEVNPALKKAGVASRTVLETIFGERPEFVTIREVKSFAEFDGQGLLQAALGEKAAAALGAKLQACEVSTLRYIANRQDEFNLGKTDAPIRATVWYRINQGAAPLYRAFLRDDIIPLNKKALEAGKIAGYSVTILGQGAPEAGLWSQTTYLPNLAALDAGGIAGQVLGDAGAQAQGARAAQLRATVRALVRRRIPELSY